MKMKMLLLVAALVLCTPFSARADSVTFLNSGGNIVSNTARTTLTLSGSLLTGVSGLASLGVPDQALTFSSCRATGCLGKIAITTGTKLKGFLFSSTATFNAGGSITVTGTNFTFTGMFAAGATWTCTPVTGAGCNSTGGTWFFNGTVVGGMLTVNGHTFAIPTAGTIQISTSGKAPIGNTGQPLTWGEAGGTTTFASPVPEPETLGLVGAGMLGLSIFARRRNSSPRYR